MPAGPTMRSSPLMKSSMFNMFCREGFGPYGSMAAFDGAHATR